MAKEVANILMYDCGSFRVCYGPASEVLRELPAAEYVIAQTDHLRTGEIAALGAAGYVFHDRLLTVEVRRKNMSRELADAVRGITVDLTDTVTDEMFALAYAAFDTDRRFCLDLDDNRRQAGTVLNASVRQWLARGAHIVRVCHDEETLGFLLAENIRGGGYIEHSPGGDTAGHPRSGGGLSALLRSAGAAGSGALQGDGFHCESVLSQPADRYGGQDRRRRRQIYP